MDSQVLGDGHLLEVADDRWREEVLPVENISVPPSELPDPEEADGGSGGPGGESIAAATLREQEARWSDLALLTLMETQGPNQPVTMQPSLQSQQHLQGSFHS
ncbi:anaphase-promoting complex subunit 13 [Ischnura elegans]|uniref:anaphase-promoting complex subunit 13 n=1 Tax=Ischnura elegans TaxID=197161 RepID=UPI001ED8A7DE|nr:anaphase-promoting complex subunit 13 [Ischnura elegans]